MKNTKKMRKTRQLHPAESVAFYLWMEIALRERSIDIEKLISLIPGGSGLKHAQSMQRLVEEIGWILFGSDGADRFVIEYGRMLIKSHVLPLLRRRFAHDEEAMGWIMIPELSVGFEESGYSVRCPENSFRLWGHVDRYFRSRFMSYPKGKHAVASIFYFSHCGYLEAVKEISLSLMEDESIDFMRKGNLGRVIRTVKALEAEALVGAFISCCS
ncbi:MAG TPA: hypothetical protein VN420_00165 [Candidatus Fimivivens sp.]|nr:hypothetical protein [Candidatus Fimivivens sp.]